MHINVQFSLPLFKASHTNTSYGSTHPSTDAAQINSENHMPYDGYNTRRAKLANKRNVMLDRKLCETAVNKEDDIVSSSGLTSPTPSSSDLTEDRDTDLRDDNPGKHPNTFGTAYSSTQSSLNTEPARKFSLNADDYSAHKSDNLMKSQSEKPLEEESEGSDICTKISRSGSFQEIGRKNTFTNLMTDIREETRVEKDSLLNIKLKSVENGLEDIVLGSKSRKGSLVMEKLNYVEEKSIPAVTNRSSNRRGSLEREKGNSTEESIHVVNESSSSKGSLNTEKINFVEESIPAIRNKSGSRRASLNNKTNLDIDSVKHVASNITEKSYVPLNESGTKNDTPCEYRFSEASEHLSEVSQIWNNIQNTILTDRKQRDNKLKQLLNNSESKVLETKAYEKKKLLAALKAIDDGQDPSIVNPGDKSSSILESLLTNSTSDPGSSLNISLPIIGQMRVLDQQSEEKVTSEERTDVEQSTTKTILMQELFGSHSADLTAGNNSV